MQEIGCLIKDLDIGLIDFPTTYRGEEVYLCWKLGEPGIEYWHGVDEGFRGRKPIDQDFLDTPPGRLAPVASWPHGAHETEIKLPAADVDVGQAAALPCRLSRA